MNLRVEQDFFRSKTQRVFKVATTLGLVLLGFASSQPALGQAVSTVEPDAWARVAGRVPHSQAGIRLGHIGVTQGTPVEQEARIWRFLRSHQIFDWRRTTVEQIARDMSQYVPCWVNVTELDLLAISPDQPISNVPPGSILNRLRMALEPLELTIAIRAGSLEITSWDSAEDEPCTRIYDVGPLLLPTINPRTQVRGLSFNALQRALADNIEPDSWIQYGGTSVIQPLQIPGREFLVISAPSMTQLTIATFLESLVLSADASGANQVLEVADKSMLAGKWNRPFPPPSASTTSRTQLPRPYLNLAR